MKCPKSSKQILQQENPNSEIIPVDHSRVKKYLKTRRFNVIFPEDLLSRVDKYKAGRGMKRSLLPAEATEEYLKA